MHRHIECGGCAMFTFVGHVILIVFLVVLYHPNLFLNQHSRTWICTDSKLFTYKARQVYNSSSRWFVNLYLVQSQEGDGPDTRHCRNRTKCWSYLVQHVSLVSNLGAVALGTF